MGQAGTARTTHRFRLLFATADDSALIELGQELAPAFFISIATLQMTCSPESNRTIQKSSLPMWILSLRPARIFLRT
jgi:hypothetical protein